MGSEQSTLANQNNNQVTSNLMTPTKVLRSQSNKGLNVNITRYSFNQSQSTSNLNNNQQQQIENISQNSPATNRRISMQTPTKRSSPSRKSNRSPKRLSLNKPLQANRNKQNSPLFRTNVHPRRDDQHQSPKPLFNNEHDNENAQYQIVTPVKNSEFMRNWDNTWFGEF